MNHLFKTLTLSVLITLGLLAQQAQAQSGLTLAQYREWKKDPIKKEMLTTYTAGMGQGVVFSNVHNKSFNLMQIFCLTCLVLSDHFHLETRAPVVELLFHPDTYSSGV